jgi:hypothetical protein
MHSELFSASFRLVHENQLSQIVRENDGGDVFVDPGFSGQEADGFCSGRTIAVMDQAMDVSERFTG